MKKQNLYLFTVVAFIIMVDTSCRRCGTCRWVNEQTGEESVTELYLCDVHYEAAQSASEEGPGPEWIWRCEDE